MYRKYRKLSRKVIVQQTLSVHFMEKKRPDKTLQLNISPVTSAGQRDCG